MILQYLATVFYFSDMKNRQYVILQHLVVSFDLANPISRHFPHVVLRNLIVHFNFNDPISRDY